MKKEGKRNIGNNTQRPRICKEGINGDKRAHGRYRQHNDGRRL